MESKRGQGNMFWVIIVAALAIIVLVVLIFILTGTTGDVKDTLSKCAIRGGECQDKPCSGTQIEIDRGCTYNNKTSDDYYCCSKK
ncbi:hypothetical protein ACFLZB_01705 [Nanoarchaeota archaeon]